MVTCDYNEPMSKVKRVGIRELKAKLSAYLREVRKGATILVQDRDECVAELRSPASTFDNPVVELWSASGEITVPQIGKTKLPKSPVCVADNLAQELLDAERGE